MKKIQKLWAKSPRAEEGKGGVPKKKKQEYIFGSLGYLPKKFFSRRQKGLLYGRL